MSKVEKENRINSLAVTFLERQQIIPHPFAEVIISAYKEGYHQAEKDLELTWVGIKMIDDCLVATIDPKSPKRSKEEFYQEVLKRFKDFKERKDGSKR